MTTGVVANKSGVSIRWLLLGVNVVVLLVPLFALVGLKLYDTYLVRQTERQLIAQAVVLGEVYREALAKERGTPVSQDYRPSARRTDTFVPIEPMIQLNAGLLEPQRTPTRQAALPEAELRAGQAVEPLLRRAQTFNLTAVRILNREGCVVATSRGEMGLCLDDLTEVRAALGGRYHAVARHRVSDEPLPPLSDVRSRGAIRIFAALPIFADGQVVGVVRVSRTSIDALTSLWHNRRGLLGVAVAATAGAVLVSLLFATLIARPLRRLTDAATAIASGSKDTPLAVSYYAPSEVRRLGEAVVSMTAELKARADYVREFALSVSHELKTPVTSIRGAVELLSDAWHTMDDAQRQRFLNNIDADAQRTDHLVNRLLYLAKLEHAEEELTHVRPATFLRELLARYHGRVSLVLESPPDNCRLNADHLASAVLNLVDNALRHGGEREVIVTASGAAGRLCVAVRDFGEGISANNQLRVFERFFTTERDRGGTGLGLAIVKATAHRYGGQVSFSTGPEGTTFRLVL